MRLPDGVADIVMAVIRTLAKRLGMGRYGAIFTCRIGQDLLHQPGAGTAGSGSLGVGANLIQGKQPFLQDCLDDLPFGDPVAAAHFGIVGKIHRGILAPVAGISQMSLAKQQLLAHFTDIGPVSQQLEIPGAICGVAVKDHSLDTVVLQHDLFVDTGRCVLHHDLLGVLIADEITGREEIDTTHLQLGRGHRALIMPDAILCEVVGADPGLLEQGCDQTIGDPPVLYTLSHRIDSRIVGLQRIVYHDAPLTIEAGLPCKLDVGPDTNRHHYQIGFDFISILESNPFHTIATQDRFRLCFHQELEPSLLQCALQHSGRGLVQLPFHEGIEQMHHSDIHPLLQQTIGRLEPQ